MQPAGGGGALAETWEDVTVYRLEVAVGEIQTSKGTTGNGHALDYRVSLFDNDVALTKHAADLTCKRFAWFVANPAGAYTGNARGKLRAKQKFEDFPTRGGIWANSMEGDGDISMELSWGIVTVTWQMTENKGAWSSWKGEVSIKGTDAEWREAPTAQANVHMTGGNRQSVTTTSTIDTFPCTYVVGNPNSCAEARVRMSCAGAVDDPGDMRGCEADVQLEVGKEVVVEIAEPPLELVE
jgi:hypothetical protein